MGTPISALPIAGALTGDELIPIVQGGVTKRAIVDDLGPAIPYTPAGTGAVATTVQRKLQESVSVFDFMTKAQIAAVQAGTSTDDTAAIQAAIDHVFSVGGGTVHVPRGIYVVSSIVKNWTSAITVNIRGEGKRATKIKKKSGTTTPIFDFSSGTGIIETYSEISDLWLEGLGSATEAALRVTDWGRWVARNLQIESCNKGIHARGALVFDVYDCTIQGNVYGYYCEKSAANIHSNLVQFFGGQISANTTYGVALQQAAGVHFYGTDMSANGAAGNISTGAIYIDATVDDETGYSDVSLNGVWMEVNKGFAIRTGNAAGLQLTLRDVFLASNENAVSVGAIASSVIYNLTAGSVTDTVSIAASRSTVVGSIIGVLTDTSTKYRHINVTTSGAAYDDVFKGDLKRHKLGTVDYVFGQASNISGGSADDVDYYLYGTGKHKFWTGGAVPLQIGPSAVGFYGTNPVTKPTVTGAKGGNAALTSLLSQLAALGLITDSTT